MNCISTILHGLETVPLGRTGMQITRVGFGAWALGGGDWAVGWGSQDDTASIEAIRHAIARGINWIDTAAIYGLGRSERVVGAALRQIPPSERPFVFTKCGLLWDDADPKAPPRQVANPRSIHREVEESLRRLGVERIDLYQVHWPSEDGAPLEEDWQAMLDLKREGKVRAVGLSNHNAPQLERAESLGHVDFVAAALLGHPPHRGRGRVALVRYARHRRDRLQPDAVWAAVGRVQPSPCAGPAARRLALPVGGFHRRGARSQPRPS